MNNINLNVKVDNIGDIEGYESETSIDLFALSSYRFGGEFNLTIDDVSFFYQDTQVLSFILKFIYALTSSARNEAKSYVDVPNYPEVIEVIRKESTLTISTTKRSDLRLKAKCNYFVLYHALHIRLNEILTLLYSINPRLAQVKLIDVYGLEAIRRMWCRQNLPQVENISGKISIVVE